MPVSRRLLPALLAAPAAMPGRPAAAQDLPPGWPERVVRLVVPAAGGAGTADTIARLLAQELDKRLPQRTVVENRPGANGNVGAATVARAAPDGHSFLFGWSGTLATSPALYRDPGFDPRRDFEPVLALGSVPNLLVVNNGLGVRTLDELTARLKREPGALSFGSSGNGSSMHLAGELYRQRSGTEMVHIPYAGIQQGFTDLFTGRIQVMFNLVTGAAPQVRGGQVTPIAILSERRSPVLPEVPTTAEMGMPGLVFSTWFAILAPRGTPAPVRLAMNRLVNEILAQPESRARLEAQGLDIIGGPPERLSALLEDDLARHAELVRFAGLRLE